MQYNSIEFILMMAAILWTFVDWAKPLWEKHTHARYISIGIALVASIAITITFGLDLIVALGYTTEVTIVGHVFAALGITAGSAILNQIGKGGGKSET